MTDKDILHKVQITIDYLRTTKLSREKLVVELDMLFHYIRRNKEKDT